MNRKAIFELLEARNLAAQYIFSADLPDTVEVGQTFDLKVFVQDTRENPQGLRGAGLGFTWEAEKLELLTDPDHVLVANWPIHQSAVLREDGWLDMVQGWTFAILGDGFGERSSVNGEIELVYQATFQAEEVGQTQITIFERGGIGFTPMVEYGPEDVQFESPIINIVEPIMVQPPTFPEPVDLADLTDQAIQEMTSFSPVLELDDLVAPDPIPVQDFGSFGQINVGLEGDNCEAA